MNPKQLADQLGVPLQQVNSDVESLLTAIVQVAEIDIARFGEPIMDEATRIEQAATRIEEAKNRIDAALAGPVAGAYEVGAYAIEQMTFSGRNPYKDTLLADRQRTTQLFQERAEHQTTVGGIPISPAGSQEFQRMAELLRGTQAAMAANKNGALALDDAVMKLATDMANSAFVTDEQRARLHELEVQLRVTSSGGIVLAETTKEIGESAKVAAGHVFTLADGLNYVAQNGRMVQLPTFGPAPGRTWDTMPNQNAVEGMFGGGLLGSVLQGPGAFQQQLGSTWRQTQTDERQLREREAQEAIRENERVARENERAWKSAADHTKQAFRDAADDLKSKIESIPGLIGTSEVTKEQMQLAEWGVPQNFADDLRRRLEDEVINKVDYADIDPAAIFARAGIDQTLDPRAQIALFNQKWADSSLFADPANLEFFNQDAIRAEFERQRQSQLGQQNILGMFGLGEDSEGTYFTELGSIMSGGMMAGAEEGLAEFGRDAIANVMMQLKSDAALTEYASLGGEIGGAIWGGVIDSTGSSDLVGAIVAEVLNQIADYLPPVP